VHYPPLRRCFEGINLLTAQCQVPKSHCFNFDKVWHVLCHFWSNRYCCDLTLTPKLRAAAACTGYGVDSAINFHRWRVGRCVGYSSDVEYTKRSDSCHCDIVATCTASSPVILREHGLLRLCRCTVTDRRRFHRFETFVWGILVYSGFIGYAHHRRKCLPLETSRQRTVALQVSFMNFVSLLSMLNVSVNINVDLGLYSA